MEIVFNILIFLIPFLTGLFIGIKINKNEVDTDTKAK